VAKLYRFFRTLLSDQPDHNASYLFEKTPSSPPKPYFLGKGIPMSSSNDLFFLSAPAHHVSTLHAQLSLSVGRSFVWMLIPFLSFMYNACAGCLARLSITDYFYAPVFTIAQRFLVPPNGSLFFHSHRPHSLLLH
jgi:hypothetical protein